MPYNPRRRFTILFLIIVALLPMVINTLYRKTKEPQFKEGDRIPLLANKAYSYHGAGKPSPYFDLPFCPPGDPIPNRKKSLREICAGDCFTETQYELKFKVDIFEKFLCQKILTRDEVAKFRNAVVNQSMVQMSCNNIIFDGNLGYVRKRKSRLRYYVISHPYFYLQYNGNQVKDIAMGMKLSSGVDVTEDAEVAVNFTYSVYWQAVETEPTFFDLPIETSKGWSSFYQLISSRIPLLWVCLCFCWLGLLFLVTVPYLRYYFTRHFPEDGISTPWQIHGDACRRPPYSSLLGAILGNGVQLLIMSFLVLLLRYYGFLSAHYDDGRKLFLLYSITSSVSAHRATSFHSRYSKEHDWGECNFQTGVLYLVPVFITVLILNIMDIYDFGSARITKFGITVKFFVLWVLGTIISLTVGGRFGYYFGNYLPSKPCKFSRSQRLTRWQSRLISTTGQMFLGGLLAFMAIFNEMDEIYASLYFFKLCGAFRTVFVNFILVILVTIIVGCLLTYYQLQKKDIDWWWRSLLRGGSTAIFMFGYGFYFYIRKNGAYFRALVIFTGYNACFCYALFMMLGTISFYASSMVFHVMEQGLHKDERK